MAATPRQRARAAEGHPGPVTSSVADDKPAEKPSRWHRLGALWPTKTRKRVAVVLAILAVVVATYVTSANLLELLFSPELNVLGYVALFVACWIGAGGALVPIPGVRAISWVMIVQQGAALDPAVVAFVAGSAMVLGQTSYFFATRAAAARARARAVKAEAEADTDAQVESEDDLEEKTPGRMARATARVENGIRRHGIITVFLVTALPSPLTTLTTTVASGSGMGYARWFLAAYAGYLTLCGILAFLGDGIFGGFFPLFGR